VADRVAAQTLPCAERDAPRGLGPLPRLVLSAALSCAVVGGVVAADEAPAPLEGDGRPLQSALGAAVESSARTLVRLMLDDGSTPRADGPASEGTAGELSGEAREWLRDEQEAARVQRTQEFVDSMWMSLE